MGNFQMADSKFQVDDEAIARKAYELWQLRGCPAGNPDQDWFEAMRLLGTAAQAKAEQGAVTDRKTDVASVWADAQAFATQAQSVAASERPAAVEPKPSSPRAPDSDPLQNGFKPASKGGRGGGGRKSGRG